nr:GNAT family N-acetyltransferase [Williamsia sp. CHRR-6]
MTTDDLEMVLQIYAEGIATSQATFETEVPTPEAFCARWHADHRWVAELDGEVVGWAALAPVSTRACYRGVAEDSVYVRNGFRSRGIGLGLMRQLVIAADEAGLWTLQTSIFPDNETSVRLHQAVGYRIVGLREKIAQLNNRWRDTVLMERRTEPSFEPI